MATGVSVDVWSVRRALAAGDLTRALERYAGPLRPGSGSLEVALLRAELHETLRGAVLRSGDAGLLARWVDGGGADDVAALEALLAVLPVGEPRQLPVCRAAGQARRHPALRRALPVAGEVVGVARVAVSVAVAR